MSMGLVVWSVLCVGVAMMITAALVEGKKRTWVSSGVEAFGLGCLAWALGLGLWMLVGVIL